MTFSRCAALAALVGGLLCASVGTAAANDGKVFAGCVTDRTDTTVTLDTSAKEHITIDTTWLKPGFRDALAGDCMTISTEIVEGKYMAVAVEAGDEPNESNETTADRANKSSKDDNEDKNSSGKSGD